MTQTPKEKFLSTFKQECYSAATLLGVAFVVLKLCGVIDWSWWWVTLPFWYIGPLLLVLGLLGILWGVLVAATTAYGEKLQANEKNK